MGLSNDVHDSRCILENVRGVTILDSLEAETRKAKRVSILVIIETITSLIDNSNKLGEYSG